jgi:hypothetical protein
MSLALEPVLEPVRVQEPERVQAPVPALVR